MQNREHPDNKAWAKGISINNSDEDRRKFYVTSHPALLDAELKRKKFAITIGDELPSGILQMHRQNPEGIRC